MRAAPAATAAETRAATTRLILEAPIAPTLARLAAPNVIAMFVTAATSIAEGYFAGLIGVGALAGLALVFPFVMLTHMLSAGAMGGAVSSAVARALGAGDVRRAERLIPHVIVIALAASGLFIGLYAAAGRALFTLLGGAGDSLAEALSYAAVFFPGCATLWLCHSLLSIIRGTGNMLMPACVLALGACASIPLSGALALGWGPVAPFGMAGLAAGIVIAHGACTLVALAYIVAGRAGLDWRNAAARLRGALFADILRVGLIASLSAIQTIATVVVMTGLVGRFGPDALAGYGLGARFEFLMMPIIFGIGAAMTAMVGANIGAGQHRRALAIGWTGSLGTAVIVGGMGALAAVFPDLWLGLFLSPGDATAYDTGRAYFHIAGPAYGLLAFGLGLYFASQGAGKVALPVLAGLVRMAVAVGGGFALTVWAGFGIAGVFAAVAAGMAIYGVLTAAAVWIGKWR